MRSAQRTRKSPASPVQPLPMVSGLMSLSGTASPGQPPSPEATRPVARWKVELAAYMASITPYPNRARDLAAVLNDARPRGAAHRRSGQRTVCWRCVVPERRGCRNRAFSRAAQFRRQPKEQQINALSAWHRFPVADWLDRTEQPKTARKRDKADEFLPTKSHSGRSDSVGSGETGMLPAVPRVVRR